MLTPNTNEWRKAVIYQLDNNGVGPARIEWVELRFKGKPVTDLTDLLDACCKASTYIYGGLNRRGNVAGALIRPGASVKMFSWEAQAMRNPAFDALRRQMDDIEWGIVKPEPVEQCIAPAVTFQPAYRGNR